MNKIGFIGGGKMASAIIKGIINSGLYKNEDIFVSDKNADALKILKDNYNINTVSSNVEVVQNAKVILFAVKPFVLRDVLNELKLHITKEHIVLSIAAGISINTIEEIIGEVPVIRIMPNTPALVNEGMSAICCGHYTKKEHTKIALDIFKSVGKVVESEEKYIDIITAVSGSSPAFYYYIINEIAKAGEKLGLDYKTCLLLSAQTAYGSAKMIMDTNISPEQLIINVTTPGGCTAVGNDVLKENKISDILYKTIEKTKEKAFELGKN
ncbi:MAG: pyrroline-5-carboxylate reductase [Candidatus Gastranaerophilales bacterium]|nr:pyrroline-5-carboxylate reductase [Candidatus Gastranaerophilales bacterium]